MKRYSILFIIFIPILMILFWLGYIHIKYRIVVEGQRKIRAEAIVIASLKDKNILESIGSCDYQKGEVVYLNEGIPFYVENEKIYFVDSPATQKLNELAASIITNSEINKREVDHYFLYEYCLPDASKYVKFYDKYIK